MVLVHTVDVVKVDFALQVGSGQLLRRRDVVDALSATYLLAARGEEHQGISPIPDIPELLVRTEVGEERAREQIEEGLRVLDEAVLLTKEVHVRRIVEKEPGTECGKSNQHGQQNPAFSIRHLRVPRSRKRVGHEIVFLQYDAGI